MAKAATSTVLVRTGDGRERTASILEGVAGGVITPGDKLEVDHSTTPPTVTRSDGTGTNPAGQRAFAVESAYKEGADAIDVNYAADEVVFFIIPVRGDVLRCTGAAAIVITVDLLLIDGGAVTAGKISIASPATPDATTVANTLIGVALEAATGVRFLMEVL